MARLTALLALAIASIAAAQDAPSANPTQPGAAEPTAYAKNRVVYVMSNNANGNAIFSLPIGSDGTLSYSQSTATGGLGGAIVGNPGPIDTLSSQGALQVLGNYLFAVNAGSNTLSMFAIDPYSPSNIKLVGSPVSTLGDFPNSVAVSEANPNLVCVSNTGTRSGIACFTISSSGLLSTDGQLHALPLHPQQSNPPSGPPNTVSQPFFSGDGSHLYVTVKGTPGTSNTGYFGSFPVSKSAITGPLTQSHPSSTVLLFGSIALPGTKVFTTDPHVGGPVLLNVTAGVATTLATYNITTQIATCWAVVSPATGLGYTADDGSNQINAFDPHTLQFMGQTVLPNGNGGNIQIKASGSMLYALSHGNSTHLAHVVALQTSGSSGAVTQIQNFALTQATDVVDGLAVYPADYYTSVS